jgi:O-succinylbenzoic acid--CoA ligase
MTSSHTSGERTTNQALVSVLIPPGAGGLIRLQARLNHALAGTGPAIAPIPAEPLGIRDAIASVIKADDLDYPIESADIAVVCSTSGSTGTPRGTLLSRNALQASAQAFGRRFGVDARWVIAMPLHRIAGLMILVRAHFNDSPVIIDPSVGGARQFSASTFWATTQSAKRQSLQDGRPLMVSLVPTQIARLLDAGKVGIEALQAYDLVLSGAAATPQPLLMRLRELGVNVVISYGMSETCGGCVFDGMPLDGVEISIASTQDAQPGRISIAGSVVASGYRLRPDLDGVSFMAGQFITHDVGALDSSGLIHVLGRLDDIVTVGGVNVALSAVEAAIRHHPSIEDVAVIDVTDPLWGSLPLAYVVLRNGDVHSNESQADLRRGIQEAVAQRIGRAATPRVVTFVSSLPMLDSGKIDRLALRLQASQDIDQGNISHPGSN